MGQKRGHLVRIDEDVNEALLRKLVREGVLPDPLGPAKTVSVG